MLSNLFLSGSNHLLTSAKWARDRLMPHAGRTARLSAGSFNVSFSISADGHFAEWAGEEAADVQLTVPLSELPGALPNGLEGIMRHVRVEGNADFADALGFVFRHLRWDVEEDLSHIIGDIAAHRLVEGGKALAQLPRHALARGGANLAEYLTEEKPTLLAKGTLSHFSSDIVALRDAVARLDKRVARLKN